MVSRWNGRAYWVNLFSMVSTGLLGRELCVYERRGRPAMERKLELGMSAAR